MRPPGHCQRQRGRGSLSLLSLLWLGLLASLGSAIGQNADQLAFDAALRDFELGQWDRAAGSFSDFPARFPDSSLKAEAAQRARFARGEGAFSRGEFARAVEEFAAYQKDYASQPRAALAAVREAAARLRLGDRAGAIAVLGATNGPFASQVLSGSEPGVIFNGLLLKAEALRGEKRLPEAEAVLNEAGTSATTPMEQRARLLALARVQEEAGQFEVAAGTAELLGKALAEGGSPDQRAEAAALEGRLWNRAGRSDRAEAAFARNSTAEAPAALQREAVLHLADVAVGRGDFPAARERLQAFLTAHPELPDAAPFRLRLGQVLLRQYLAAGGATNTSPENTALLGLAAVEFDAGLGGPSSPETSGMLHLGRGWTYWHEAVAGGGSDRLRAAAGQFTAAAAALTTGPAQATARFKLADTQFRLQESAAALTNYLAVAEGYPTDPQVQSELVERALQQAVLAAVEVRDPVAAGRVVEQLLARQPAATAAGDSTLQVAQALSKLGNQSGARAVLQRFLKGYPDSPLVADVEFALITLDLRASDWTNAAPALDRWILTHTNHPSLVRAEYDRAWTAARAGASTNAVAQFASLTARYPTNAITQVAALWLAGRYFSLGEYARAEEVYVSVVTNAPWHGSAGWHQARLWAAEAARRRLSPSAREQLVVLLNDRSTPTNLVPSAYFALGELDLEQPPAAGQPAWHSYQQALEAFTAAAQYTNSPVAIAALGKMADCHLQLASMSTNSYAKAEELYRRVQESASSDVSVRSKAAFGRGVVAEKLAGLATGASSALQLTEALNRYLEVLNGGLLRPGEVPDPWWVKEAGREAGRLLEYEARWNDAAVLYDRLAQEFPAQRASWELKSAEARRRANGGGKPGGQPAGTGA